MANQWNNANILFLPTPSARRATPVPRMPAELRKISTHALREEGDYGTKPTGNDTNRFLPTPSARRATCLYRYGQHSSLISTHALREEGDSCRRVRQPPRYAISTHALREEGD